MSGAWICAAVFLVQSSAIQETRPEFEAVSLRPFGSTNVVVGPGEIGFGPRVRPCSYVEDRVTCDLPIRDLIQEAYGLKKIQVVGPEWLKSEAFSLKAVMAPGTRKDQARLMLQSALADRFGLKFHEEERDIPIYALLPGKHGVKLVEADDVEHRTKAIMKTPTGSMTASMYMTRGRFVAVAMSLDNLADTLTPLVDLPVINMTGLTAQYKIDVQWKPMDVSKSQVSGIDPDLVTAVQEQLGLRLEKRKASYKLFIIDHIERMPSVN